MKKNNKGGNMENKYINMSHNYKIITQAGRITESRKMQQQIKGNPSQFRGKVNKVAQDVRLLNVTINNLKQQKEQLQTSINNYKNNPYIAIKFLTGLENNLEKVINEIALKEKEKEYLKQNL